MLEIWSVVYMRTLISSIPVYMCITLDYIVVK